MAVLLLEYGTATGRLLTEVLRIIEMSTKRIPLMSIDRSSMLKDVFHETVTMLTDLAGNAWPLVEDYTHRRSALNWPEDHDLKIVEMNMAVTRYHRAYIDEASTKYNERVKPLFSTFEVLKLIGSRLGMHSNRDVRLYKPECDCISVYQYDNGVVNDIVLKVFRNAYTQCTGQQLVEHPGAKRANAKQYILHTTGAPFMWRPIYKDDVLHCLMQQLAMHYRDLFADLKKMLMAPEHNAEHLLIKQEAIMMLFMMLVNIFE